MGAVLWFLLGLTRLVGELRRVGEPGRERFRRLNARRARVLHDRYVSKAIPFVDTSGIALSVLGVVFAAAGGSAVGATVWAAAAVLLLASLAVRRKVKPAVLQEFHARGLEPLSQRDRSRKRDRRQLQFGIVALLGFMVNQVATYLAERLDHPAMIAVAAISLLVAIAAGFALLWSTTWIYGDEERI